MKKRTSLRFKSKWSIKTRLVVGAVLILAFVGSGYLIYKGVDFTQFVNNPILYKYNISKNVNYKVHLFENNLYDENIVSSNSSYVGSLTDKIEIVFDVNFESLKDATFEYKYFIDSIIYADATSSSIGENQNVWKKKEILKDESSGQMISNKKIKISDTLMYDYNKYNLIAKDYRRQMGFAMNIYSLVNFNINIHGNTGGYLIDEDEVITLKIPLNESVFKIDNSVGKDITFVKRRYNNPKIVLKFWFLIIGLISSIFVIFIFAICFRRLFNLKRKNEYNKMVDRILKEYGDVIVEVKSMNKLSVSKTIVVKNFNEMVDLEEETRIPINFYEDEIDSEGIFWLIHNDSIYMYRVSQEELLNKKG